MRGRLDTVDFGIAEYTEIHRLQKEILAARQSDLINDTLLLGEHYPVYTTGRRGNPANFPRHHKNTAKQPIPVLEIERGGDITYHGPGQLIAYPIIALDSAQEGPAWFVAQLEKLLCRLLTGYGLSPARDPKHRGVWLGNEKIAAIGIRISRGVTWHGFALNIDVEMTPYRDIVPCGIKGRGVTSLRKSGVDIAFSGIKSDVAAAFRQQFGYEEGTFTCEKRDKRQ